MFDRKPNLNLSGFFLLFFFFKANCKIDNANAVAMAILKRPTSQTSVYLQSDSN